MNAPSNVARSALCSIEYAVDDQHTQDGKRHYRSPGNRRLAADEPADDPGRRDSRNTQYKNQHRPHIEKPQDRSLGVVGSC